MQIITLSPHPAITFAASELANNLHKLSINSLHIHQLNEAAYDPSRQKTVWLGCFRDFNLTPAGPDPALDDEIHVEFANESGFIAGANPRSVLIGVYRFLTQAGCRWLRPGETGELIPQVDLAALKIQLHEKASYRHRAITIEGAVSLQNVLEIIDWAPKVGFSGYFMQFREGHTFFDRWYDHRHNPLMEAELFTVDQARQFTQEIEAELEKRDMLYHAVGHGWTCEAYDIPGLGWDPVIQDWPQEVLQDLAEVNGKRAMWQDIPLITSLCFSKSSVRKRVVDCIADYASEHPNIAYLHFWLDDGFNNKCECVDCRQKRPADWYVKMLNELDAELADRSLETRIVFLAYADLLWPPESERIENPERFVLMFAPINRPYRELLSAQNPDRDLPPFVLNHSPFPTNAGENLAFLRAWQEIFPGDSFVFDYYLMLAGTYTYDPDHLKVAGLLSQDIQHYPQLGLNGLVSCQLQRIFFPTGLGMTVMGRTLWDASQKFSTLFNDYFSSAFGEDWRLCKEFLCSFSELEDLVDSHRRYLDSSPEAIKRFEAALKRVEDFMPVIEKNLQYSLPIVRTASWFYLKLHAQIIQHFTRMLIAYAQDRNEDALSQWEVLKRFVQENEVDLQPVFDVYQFIDSYDRFVYSAILKTEQ